MFPVNSLLNVATTTSGERHWLCSLVYYQQKCLKRPSQVHYESHGMITWLARPIRLLVFTSRNRIQMGKQGSMAQS